MYSQFQVFPRQCSTSGSAPRHRDSEDPRRAEAHPAPARPAFAKTSILLCRSWKAAT